jgi:hypothetical protein
MSTLSIVLINCKFVSYNCVNNVLCSSLPKQTIYSQLVLLPFQGEVGPPLWFILQNYLLWKLRFPAPLIDRMDQYTFKKVYPFDHTGPLRFISNMLLLYHTLRFFHKALQGNRYLSITSLRCTWTFVHNKTCITKMPGH